MKMSNYEQYAVENTSDGYLLRNSSGELVGHVTSIITDRTVYHLNKWSNDPLKQLHDAQIFSTGGTIRAMGRITLPQDLEVMTSAIRDICVTDLSGNSYQLPSHRVSAPERVMLITSENSSVYVSGQFAITNCNDQKAIDAEAARQVRVHEKGLGVDPRDLRMSNFPVLGHQ